uniref:Uncharacterized protein n=1 Tax=viral metagenome TaxID=1070528 RepID=A0A6C0E7X3_9ZZZZ
MRYRINKNLSEWQWIKFSKKKFCFFLYYKLYYNLYYKIKWLEKKQHKKKPEELEL